MKLQFGAVIPLRSVPSYLRKSVSAGSQGEPYVPVFPNQATRALEKEWKAQTKRHPLISHPTQLNFWKIRPNYDQSPKQDLFQIRDDLQNIGGADFRRAHMIGPDLALTGEDAQKSRALSDFAEKLPAHWQFLVRTPARDYPPSMPKSPKAVVADIQRQMKANPLSQEDAKQLRELLAWQNKLSRINVYEPVRKFLR